MQGGLEKFGRNRREAWASASLYSADMTYSITGLDPRPYAYLSNLTDVELLAEGAVRMTANTTPGFPCRVTLDDAQPGETLLLLNHVSHQGGPYHASHAIFVSEGHATPAHYVDEVPPALAHRMLSIRAFDAAGMMIEAGIAHIGEADTVIRRLLDNPATHHLDAHNATRGCFAARVERG